MLSKDLLVQLTSLYTQPFGVVQYVFIILYIGSLIVKHNGSEVHSYVLVVFFNEFYFHLSFNKRNMDHGTWAYMVNR